MEHTVKLMPIKDLIGMNFYIPEYQRGYRWGRQQTTDLLEDIYAFAEKISDDSDEIYCIQPLVVSERKDDILAKCKSPSATLEDIKKYIKGSWNVVDGQQRLTTIYILLRCLGNSEVYEIDYNTRKGSKDFLANIESKGEKDKCENIDYFYMLSVYSTINEWLGNKDKDRIRDILLNNVDVIWYEIDSEDEISVFTRLNIGKIPLTDAELIKALFLNRDNFGMKLDDTRLEIKQHEIASEWDHIEYALQNDEFWAFLHNVNYAKPTRIDFILDLIKSKDGYKLYNNNKSRNTKKHNYRDEKELHNRILEEKIGNDEHATFRYFNEAFLYYKQKYSDNDRIDKLWCEIKNITVYLKNGTKIINFTIILVIYLLFKGLIFLNV